MVCEGKEVQVAKVAVDLSTLFSNSKTRRANQSKFEAMIKNVNKRLAPKDRITMHGWYYNRDAGAYGIGIGTNRAGLVFRKDGIAVYDDSARENTPVEECRYYQRHKVMIHRALKIAEVVFAGTMRQEMIRAALEKKGAIKRASRDSKGTMTIEVSARKAGLGRRPG